MRSLSSNAEHLTEHTRENAMTLFEQGQTEDAIALLRALAASSAQDAAFAAECWNDLGNIYAHGYFLGGATSAFRRAIKLNPNSALIWNNLGGIFRRLGENQSAEFAFRQAIARQAQFFAAHQNLAELLDLRGEALEAARHHCIAYVEGPREGKSFEMLGVAFYHLGQKELAADVYREWLTQEPDNPVAQHRLASCVSEGVPTRMSDECAEAMFDAFAPSFDAHLAGLDYQGPSFLFQALSLALQGKQDLNILDAGCGTGLCGPLLRPIASQLVGVDISSAILQKARDRDCYDRLEKAELTAYLPTVRDPFDVLAACDTFNYFGELLPVFQGAFHALKPLGLLVFTVEDGLGAAMASGWHLAVHGRYVHEDHAIQQWLHAAGFDIQKTHPIPLRQELGSVVQAHVYVAQRRVRVE